MDNPEAISRAPPLAGLAVSTQLRELPSRPACRAVFLGWATPAPVVVEIRALDEKQRPWSSDPRF